jgi:hypothetical protein
MTLPTFTQFSDVTLALTGDLDNNFNVLAAMAATPCGVSGTNALTLTVMTNAPYVTQYYQLQAFIGVAVATNTGNVTAQVGSFSSLNVYKASASGPMLLAGGEIAAGDAFTLVYDSSLHAGAGGFHLYNIAVAGNYLPLSGGTISSLSVSGTLTATNASIASISAASLTSGSASITNLDSGKVSALSIVIGSGSTISSILSTTATLSFTVAPAGIATQTVILPGCAVNDTILLGLPASINPTLSFSGYVSSTGTISVVAYNMTASAITQSSLTFRISDISVVP